MNNKILIFILIIISFSSCLEDKSNVDFKKINKLKISGLKRDYNVYSGDTLTIVPVVTKAGCKLEDIQCEWFLTGNDYKLELGEGNVLDTIINVPPSSSAYKLRLSVTDKSCGLMAWKEITVNVKDKFGSGFIIVHSKDGSTCQVDFLKSGLYEWYHRTDDIFIENAYKNSNGTTLNEKVKQVYAFPTGDNNNITFLTDNKIMKIKTVGFKNEELNNNDFFMNPINDDFHILEMIGIKGRDYLLTNDKIYLNKHSGGNKIFVPLLTTDFSDYKISKMYYEHHYPAPHHGCFYDELNHRFLRLNTWNLYDMYVFKNYDPENDAFDPRNVGDLSCLSISPVIGHKFFAVMKNNQDNSMYVYRINPLSKDNEKPPYFAGGINNLNQCQDIKFAKYFDTTIKSDALFYATADKIYSVAGLDAIDSPDSKLQFSSPAGEVITSIKVYHGKGCGLIKIPNENPLEDDKSYRTEDQLLIVTTYNQASNSGKMYNIAITDCLRGELEQNNEYHVVRDGFGEILGLDYQDIN